MTELFSYKDGKTFAFSHEVVDAVAVPVLTDYVVGMRAVYDIKEDENFDDAWEALTDQGCLSRESFIETTRDYFHDMGSFEGHFDLAMGIVLAEAVDSLTDEMWHDFLAKHYEGIKAFFPTHVSS